MDLHLGEQKSAGEIQERVSRICHEQIIPALSRLCDELSPEQGRMIVDKLELDIGVLNKGALDHELTDRLLTQFKEEVKKLKLASMYDFDPSFGEAGSKTGLAEQESRSRVDLLIHFFRHGSVPWWNPYSNRDTNQWIREQFREDAQSLITAVGNELGQAAFRSRTVHSFSDQQFRLFFMHHRLEKLFQLYLSIKDEIHQQNVQQHRTVPWRQLRNSFLETLLEQLWVYKLSGIQKSGAGELSSATFSSRHKKIALAHTIRALEKSHDLPQDIMERAIRSLTETTMLFTPDEWQEMYDLTDLDSGSGSAGKSDIPPVSSGNKSASEPSRHTSREQFLEIENAGLVLLWTNLARLFSTLGYVDEQEFVNEQAVHRAIHLLHFVSTGENTGEEHEWPLNKLLCGLPPESFVPYEIELTDREKDEAQAMIQAAINNWDALKNTSIEGFRDAFLQRDGILTPDINGWKLQVERLSYDILLDQLPWPISIIKLPWNDHLIHVQW
ncbi:contractile injection system tape measure protein [Aliifodinibius sp. S!AR15-10]|uniref:contractile injection system tape measure protein n=1 Tax=Aliifodinibius sp. S!AR15-10 TaxID=2950437 RepID=UPI002865B76C|nr:contractile injection system tape measure protein [Aliifodinibius sp. S!AR15-10]MDR8390608.1 contractile injection system tape measure protein [Aliifodinibius sp. S!AR15-10]